MFGFTRRPGKPKTVPVATAPAMFEPLESRQLLSGTITPALNGTNLPLTAVRSTLPNAVIAGSRLRGVVLVDLTNSSTVLDRGSHTFTVYASADGVVDASDRQLGTFTRPLAIPAGRFARTAIAVRPQAAPQAGQYNILVQGTDASGEPTTTLPLGTLSVGAPIVTLGVNVGTVSPTALVPGRVFTFRATLTNTGNINAVGAASIAIGLSPDGVNLVYPALNYRRTLVVRANRATPLVLRAVVPLTVPAGTYQPYVSVTFDQIPGASRVGFSTTPITVGTNSLPRGR